MTDQGRARWQAAGAPELTHGPALDLFAPGCLGVSRARRARLSDDPQALENELNRHSPFELSDLPGWVGEAVVTPDFARRLYEIAQSLPEVRTVHELADQLGRRGLGLSAVERDSRRELIFSADRGQLLGV